MTGGDTACPRSATQSGGQGGGGSRSTERSICPRALRSCRPGPTTNSPGTPARCPLTRLAPGPGAGSLREPGGRHLKYISSCGSVSHKPLRKIWRKRSVRGLRASAPPQTTDLTHRAPSGGKTGQHWTHSPCFWSPDPCTPVQVTPIISHCMSHPVGFSHILNVAKVCRHPG